METRYIERDMTPFLMEASKEFPALIVTGPRQSGKTTLLKKCFGRTHQYVSLDSTMVKQLAKRDPRLFFDEYIPPIIIDEIQYAPELLPYIKIMIDENRMKKGAFILTGSQTFPLLSQASETLAGRIALFKLESCSIHEQYPESPVSLDDIKHAIVRGGYPELVVDRKRNADRWFSSYVQTYLERDVRNIRAVEQISDFERFLELMAAYNGQVVHLSERARDLGVAVHTVKSWLSVLEASNIVSCVKPFYKNKGKRIIKSPKLYFLDTGLLSYLQGKTIDQVLRGPASGSFFETVVYGELLRCDYARGIEPRIFWWRTSHGDEVDFVVERKGCILPIEVKVASEIGLSQVAPLERFMKTFSPEAKKGIVITVGDKTLPITSNISMIPFAQFVKEGL